MSSLWRRVNASLQLYRAVHINSKLPTVTPCLYHTLRKEPKVYCEPNSCTYSVIRFKSKKQQKDPDSDDEKEKFDDGDDDFTLSKDSKVVKINATSLRTDMVLKSALGVARNKIEQLFYESKIRVNGKKILKKSIPVRKDYEIDIIKSISPKNPDHLYVSRVIILNIIAKEESIVISARRFKNLLIENYEEDPYKGTSEEE